MSLQSIIHSLDVHHIPGPERKDGSQDGCAHQHGVVDHDELCIITEAALRVAHHTGQHEQCKDAQEDGHTAEIVLQRSA